jgi:hypothetical protein
LDRKDDREEGEEPRQAKGGHIDALGIKMGVDGGQLEAEQVRHDGLIGNDGLERRTEVAAGQDDLGDRSEAMPD